MSVLSDVAFVATKNFFPEKCDDWCRGFAAHVEKVAVSGNVVRCAVLDERLRIAAIIAHGNETGDLQSAINLALASDLSAADATAILAARDSGAPIKPN